MVKITYRHATASYSYAEIEIECESEKIAESLDYLYKQVVAADLPTEEPKKAPAQAAPNCGICGGDVWDNRNNKKNPKAPDYKCKKCGGVMWLTGHSANNWVAGK